MTLWKWSQTAASNGTIDSTVRAEEGQAPSTVNDGIRGAMAAMAKYRDDISGNLLTAGTATAYTVTTSQVLAALTDGFQVSVRMHTTNGLAATLNVDGLGAKAIDRAYGYAVPAGLLLAGTVQTFVFDSSDDAWILKGYVGLPKVVGEIFDFAGATAPSQSLLCYGQEISRTTYAALFAAIGTTWGTGDGSTTFNVPDFRGRVTAGQDDMGGTSANRLTSPLNGDTLGAVGGAESVTLATTDIPSHSHDAGTLATDTEAAHSHNITVDGWAYGSGGIAVTTLYSSAGDVRHTTDFTVATASAGGHDHDVTGDTGSTGGGQAHNNVQPTAIVNKCIFAGV